MRRVVLTREHLAEDDDHDWAERYRGFDDITSPDERREALARTLAAVEDWKDVWTFGYGSLLWNPTVAHDCRETGTVYGLHRALCLKSHIGRGTPECPGLMLGLDRGGSCRGVAFRIAGPDVAGELDLLFKREMLTRIYRPTWVRVRTSEGVRRALTFVVNRDNPRYVRGLDERTQTEMIASAAGQLGPCHEYLLDTVHHLGALGITDRRLSRLAERVEQRLAERPRV